MQNEHSTSGFLEDLVRGFVQLCALELHAKTSLEKSEHKIHVVDADDVIEASDDIEKADKHLIEITKLRRNSMIAISNYAKELNLDKWCEVKHAAMAMITFFEVHQANPNNNELFDLYIEANNLFIEIVADFIGIEIEPCAACFSDALKEVTKND